MLPSHQENFGIVVAEAMACGVPVLISNQVNIWREVQQDGAGLVADDSEAGTVALLERWLAMDDEARQHMATRARASFLRRFEIDRAAASVAHAISTALTSLRRAA
jgi:glycosyltransferase involved in cell wall biosynthesis